MNPLIRATVYLRDGHRCTECDRREGDQSEPPSTHNPRFRFTYPVRLTVHHVLAWALGGCNHVHNLLTLCDQCNSRRGTAP